MDLRPLHPLAASRRDLLTAEDLLGAGHKRSAIDAAVRLGRLHTVHPGVYSLGVHRDREDTWLAAVLACGPGALLSHRCAADLWGFFTAPEELVEVSAARSRRGPAGVTLHRPRALPGGREWRGLPVTTPLRTLVDLADVVSFDVLLTAAMEADHQRRVDLRRLRPVVGRRGQRKVERLLEYVGDGDRSAFERLARTTFATGGLPPHEANVRVHGRLLDCVWREQRVAVECDGYAHHRQRRKFESDRRVALELELHGWLVKRVTWRQLRHEAPLVVASIAAALRRQARAASTASQAGDAAHPLDGAQRA